MNLLDGDASTVAFTVATRKRMSVYRKLGGTRMALLMLLHPIRMLRMLFQSGWEWLREEWERAVATVRGRVTHSEGVFPVVRGRYTSATRETPSLVSNPTLFWRSTG